LILRLSVASFSSLSVLFDFGYCLNALASSLITQFGGFAIPGKGLVIALIDALTMLIQLSQVTEGQRIVLLGRLAVGRQSR